jgi:glucan phosphoethanolaminetransferase (alkaline phosphatase superfamily)
MKIKVYLLTLFLTFLTSIASVLLLLFYMDVETNPAVGYVTMGLAVFLAAASLLTIFIFAFKKIYYRGEVYIQTVNSSLRQAIFFTLAGIGMVAFYHYGVLTWLT